MGKKRNTYSFLVGKPERKRPLGRPRRRYGMYWTGIAGSCTTGDLSSNAQPHRLSYTSMVYYMKDMVYV
jgi:hypothetical protein